MAEDDFKRDLNRFSLYFLALGIGKFVTIYVATAGFLYAGDSIARKVRERYLDAILRQNVGYFDRLGAGEITTRITTDTNAVQDGISQKVGLNMTAVSTFLSAFVIGFVKSWKLTLVMFSVVVAICADFGVGSIWMVKYNARALEATGEGGTVVEEVVSSIRNAVAFGTQDKLARQYGRHLAVAQRWGLKMRLTLTFMISIMFGIIFLNYGLGFWQGSRFLVQGDLGLAEILTILLAVIIGAFALGQVGPDAQAFSSGVAAGVKIFSTIDRVSPMDPASDAGLRPDRVAGAIELRRVKHVYPSRPEVTVMEDVDLVVPAGGTTALVGPSGSGKSTVVGLVERFYDPVGGDVLLDGHSIRTLNLRWLRQQIALVSQEPVLFGTTVYDNIRHGLIGTPHEHDDAERQRELVVDAARMANAHDFITGLPEGYETNVGERGFLMSGGQKQRIAIARAVVGDPKILLLDEATSALDTKSEGIVQAALEAASRGRTTIVIAHRLSTIKTADNIVVMSRGRVIEQGRHDELIDKRGAYYNLVEAQKIAAGHAPRDGGDDDDDNDDNDDDEDDEDDHAALQKKLTRMRSGGGASVVPSDPDDVRIRGKLERTATGKSVSSVVLQGRKVEEHRHYPLWTLIKVIASYNKPEWHWTLVGLGWSIVSGVADPIQAVFFAKAIVALSLPPPLWGELRSEINFWAGMYLLLAFTQFVAFNGQGAFAYTAEKLIYRARDRSFRLIMRQDIAFFDRDENTAGALTSFLSTQTQHLASLSGSTLGTILTSATTLIASFAVALAFGWKLALVIISTTPILLGCGFFRFWLLAKFEERSKSAYQNSAGFACEATSAIRTIASLTREQDVWRQYHASLNSQGRKSLRSALKTSILYAASQALVILCNGLGFWYGGRLIAEREYDLFQFFVCFAAIIFGAQSAGTVFAFAGDMGKAKHAAQELKRLADQQPTIDTWSTDGERLEDGVEGYIEFRDVHFRYPTRPEQPVLRGLNLSVKPGQYVALVGPSGCGKSTTIALLERFYDPLTGGVYVDGKEISGLNLNDYRKQLALVSQEPTLYQGSLRENILLGADNDDVAEEAIIQACKDANIYDFIMSLPWVSPPFPFSLFLFGQAQTECGWCGM